MAYSFENFYQGQGVSGGSGSGGYSDLFIGYRIPASRIGGSVNPATANQIGEVTRKLNTGIKVIEMGPINPAVLESIPKQHFKEINRLSKLTGSEVTVHAPAQIDISGLTKEGLSEQERGIAEKRLWNALQQAAVVNPGAPVTIHSSAGTPGEIYVKKNGTEVLETMPVVDIEGNFKGMIKREEIASPEYIAEEGKPKMMEVRDKLKMLNEKAVKDTIAEFHQNKMIIDNRFGEAIRLGSTIENAIINGKVKEEDLSPVEKQSLMDRKHALTIYNNMELGVRDFFDKLWKSSTPEIKEKLKRTAKTITENMKNVRHVDQRIEFLGETLDQLSAIARMPDIGEKIRLLRPMTEVAKERASETLSNLAVRSATKFGDKSPIVSVENIYPEWAFSRAEQLRGLIEESRKKFVEKTKSKLGDRKARETAEKLIGTTWDVGHINMLKKYGYSDEDIKAEAKKISKFVKHVHLTDNFGYDDTHLGPGMGNVPIKGQLEQLKGYKGRYIVEAGGLAQNFKIPFYQYSLEALGSPLYNYQMQPVWNQAAAAYPSSYTGEYVFPETHAYGFGFSALPTDLGGQARGKGFSQAPME